MNRRDVLKAFSAIPFVGFLGFGDKEKKLSPWATCFADRKYYAQIDGVGRLMLAAYTATGAEYPLPIEIIEKGNGFVVAQGVLGYNDYPRPIELAGIRRRLLRSVKIGGNGLSKKDHPFATIRYEPEKTQITFNCRLNFINWGDRIVIS